MCELNGMEIDCCIHVLASVCTLDKSFLCQAQIVNSASLFQSTYLRLCCRNGEVWQQEGKKTQACFACVVNGFLW